jgi:hypothetical protein
MLRESCTRAGSGRGRQKAARSAGNKSAQSSHDVDGGSGEKPNLCFDDLCVCVWKCSFVVCVRVCSRSVCAVQLGLN